MIRYDKLVRDRIPEIIAATGERCDVRVLDEAEYAQRLDAKLAEEIEEYRRDGGIDELVDLVEVVRAIVAARGISWEEFERQRTSKAAARGRFTKRLLLESLRGADTTEVASNDGHS